MRVIWNRFSPTVVAHHRYELYEQIFDCQDGMLVAQGSKSCTALAVLVTLLVFLNSAPAH